jgi:hypothetical protein
MMLYIIGPWTFQMIALGLILETLGVDYEKLTNTRQQNQNQSRQEAA